MKKSLIFLLCAMFLGIVFFACSDNGLDAEVLGIKKEPVLVFCFISEEEGCLKVSSDVCKRINGETRLSESACHYLPSSSSEPDTLLSSSSDDSETDPSSSSESEVSSSSDALEVSSSSAVVDVSSSSAVVDVSSSSAVVDVSSSSVVASSSSSSSSIVPPSSSSSRTIEKPANVTLSGPFYFRNCDFNVNDVCYYKITTSIYTSASPPPTGGSQLYNDLSITNAAAAGCVGGIGIEVEGGGPGFEIPYGSNITDNQPTALGAITAYAVATCGGTKYTLAFTSATIVPANYDPPPQWSNCSMPQYVRTNEPIADLKFISIVGGSSTCPITYSVGNSQAPATSLNLQQGAQSLSITARTSCSGLSDSTCTRSVTAVRDIKKSVLHTFENVSTGNTYIEVPDNTNQFGCTGDPRPSFSINGTSITGESGSYWAAIPIDIKNNGNRILFNTQQTGLECKPE